MKFPGKRKQKHYFPVGEKKKVFLTVKIKVKKFILLE